jgi:sugar O-acyltransferase (sialic acid O-acetyltransferase NeuD family)
MTALASPDFSGLLIVGAGGSGREIAWLARDALGSNIQIAFAVEPEYLLVGPVDDIPVHLLNRELASDSRRYVIAVGDSMVRKRLSDLCDAFPLAAATLVHPSVVRSTRVEIGAGSVVYAGAILTTNVRLGRHVHVNVGCTLSHDVQLGDFATLSPGVHVSGHVRIEAGVFVGTGANIINANPNQPLVIGRGAVIAAGACVTRPIDAGTMVAGVPAVRKR